MRRMLILVLGLSTDLLNGGIQLDTRGLVPEDFVVSRPAGKPAAVAKPKPQYRSPAAAAVPFRGVAARQLGVTLWRLRPAAAADTSVRILVQEEGNSAEWIPERVATDSNLRRGDHVRLTIESPESGYLYVVDRERYASGQLGQPYLIFPTSRTRGGDNKVTAGMLIDIPGQEDRPSFFTLRQSRADQTGEELTVLLTAQPIAELPLTPKAQLLTPEQLLRWEKEWGAKAVQSFDLAGGAGQPWTRAEQQAGANATRLLTQEDPPPQTIYRIAAKPGDPVMIKVRLRYGTGK